MIVGRRRLGYGTGMHRLIQGLGHLDDDRNANPHGAAPGRRDAGADGMRNHVLQRGGAYLVFDRPTAGTGAPTTPASGDSHSRACVPQGPVWTGRRLHAAAEGRTQRPNQRALRLEPNSFFSATSATRRLAERAGRLRPGEEVDVDAADAPGSELDVAGARARRSRPAARRRGRPRSATRRRRAPRLRRRRRPSARRPWRRRRPRRRPGTASRASSSSTGT